VERFPENLPSSLYRSDGKGEKNKKVASIEIALWKRKQEGVEQPPNRLENMKLRSKENKVKKHKK